jgi:hypothetical protein
MSFAAQFQVIFSGRGEEDLYLLYRKTSKKLITKVALKNFSNKIIKHAYGGYNYYFNPMTYM